MGLDTALLPMKLWNFYAGIRGLSLWIEGVAKTSWPRITAGAGAPSGTLPAGSVYFRRDGAQGTEVYYTTGSGTWYARNSLAALTLTGTLTAVAAAFSGAITSTSTITTTRGVSSGTALAVGGLAYASTAASTAITGTTETETLFSTQYSMPANTLAAGTRVRIVGQGIYTATTGSETHSIILKIGSVAIVTLALVDPADNNIFYFDCTLICRTAGASGTIVATGTCLDAAATAAGTAKPFFLASTTLDTTAANIIGVAIDRQGTATDSDSARLDVLTVDIVG